MGSTGSTLVYSQNAWVPTTYYVVCNHSKSMGSKSLFLKSIGSTEPMEPMLTQSLCSTLSSFILSLPFPEYRTGKRTNFRLGLEIGIFHLQTMTDVEEVFIYYYLDKC